MTGVCVCVCAGHVTISTQSGSVISDWYNKPCLPDSKAVLWSVSDSLTSIGMTGHPAETAGIETDAAELRRGGKKSRGIPVVMKMHFSVMILLLYLHSSESSICWRNSVPTQGLKHCNFESCFYRDLRLAWLYLIIIKLYYFPTSKLPILSSATLE